MNASYINPDVCQHEEAIPAFDEDKAHGLSSAEVQKRWPRFCGNCPTCGTPLIQYASWAHYIMGDW